MKSTRGFSLMEILIAVSILGILTTIGISGFSAISRGGRDALRKSDLEQMRSALEIYKSDNGQYPPESTACVATLSTTYIKPYPDDPKDPLFTYCYQRVSNLTYVICAHLENGDLATDNCGGTNACASNCNYEVTNP